MPNILGLILTFWACAVWAVPLKPSEVPPPLQPWTNWVLQDVADFNCPFFYADGQQKQCSWPGQLSLKLTAKQGDFSSTWQVYKEDWISLPGGNKFWPLNVTANDKAMAVINQDGTPKVKLVAGSYQLKGRFLWDSIPESLQIPAQSGLVDLAINGKAVPFPAIKEGAIWLKESDIGQKKPQQVENKIDLQVFRQINDDVPLQLITFLELEVSGQQREIKLPHALLADFIPIRLQSPLPARIESDGSLSLQVRPGRWHIELAARYPKQTTALALNFSDKTWPAAEIWVFNAQPYQRLVEVQNALPLDPSQTNLPQEWKTLPAYQMLQGQAMSFKVIRRGDPEPEPNYLNLTRQLWLNFDGSGYAVQDQISGKMTNGWRLNALPEMQLGQIKLNGENQLITTLKGNNRQGVEVRQGQLNLTVDSRLVGNIALINAVGWEQPFHQVSSRLHLPPGWRLLAVTGVDNDPNCWLSNWTLLDIFLVLISSVAVAQLWNRHWGLIALLCLVLTWQEAGAPQWVWLNILAARGLLNVLPQQTKLRTWITAYRNLSWLTLLLIGIPFLVNQVRTAIYPQLEGFSPLPAFDLQWLFLLAGLGTVYLIGIALRQAEIKLSSVFLLGFLIVAMIALSRSCMDNPDGSKQKVGGGSYPAAPPVPQEQLDAAAPAPAADAAAPATSEEASAVMANKKAEVAQQQVLRSQAMQPMKKMRQVYSFSGGYVKPQQAVNFNRIDANANLQTGLGLPQWHWHEVTLSWNGVVDNQQAVHLWLLNPTMTMLLNFVRVAMVVLLSLLLFDLSKKLPFKLPAALLCLLLLPFALTVSEKSEASDFPDQTLLNQLKERLTEAQDCLPQCAEIARLDVSIDHSKMTLQLQVHAQHNVALPLPAHYKEWFPNQVLLDGQPAVAMLRDDNGQLWLNVSAGLHQVVMSGLNPEQSKFTLPLTLKPHYVTVQGSGWSIEGVHENGEAEDQLQFNRVQSQVQAGGKQLLEQGALPAFITVERSLELGLDWRLTTRLNRVIATDTPVLVEIPLLKGESVTTPEIRVKNGKVQVSLSAYEQSTEWVSILEKNPQLELTATPTTQWTEIWRADVSPMWHLQSSGIAVVHHQDAQGYWLPEWRPWPTEKVTLNISRPEAVEGRTLTIDHSKLSINPGKRSQDVNLELTVRSSKGSQHSLTLPEAAQLQTVQIDGVTQPIRQKGRTVTLPIKPGEQKITLNWQQMQEQSVLLHSPPLNLGLDSVNSDISIQLGEDRWVIVTVGPRFGPAVLFWGVLVVIAGLSYALSQINSIPVKSWQWFLLLIGLSQLHLAASLLVIAWLVLLGQRGKSTEAGHYFNEVQVLLALLTGLSLIILFNAVKQGLLGLPDMQISGNNSSAFMLNWYQDRVAADLPEVTVIALPIMAYRGLMLLWSLWLAVSLLNWLKWGWQCFSFNGLWKSKPQLQVSEETPVTGDKGEV